MTNELVRNLAMSTTLAEAKAHLSDLVVRAAGGETVRITRRGKPVAALVAARLPRKPIDLAGIQAIVRAMPMQPEPAGELLRRMRDDARY